MKAVMIKIMANIKQIKPILLFNEVVNSYITFLFYFNF